MLFLYVNKLIQFNGAMQVKFMFNLFIFYSTQMINIIQYIECKTKTFKAYKTLVYL